MRAHTTAVADALRGGVAGVVATWTMGPVTTFLYDHESHRARRAEDEARGNQVAYEVAAEKTAATVGLHLSEARRRQVGSAIHWALGVGAGSVYALLRRRLPAADAGAGMAFGAAFWLIVDEGANWALGVTPRPSAFPWQTHARGLAGHLVFGVAARAVLEALEPRR